MPKKQLIIWQFSDGKPGHQNQAKGLIQAMASHCNIEQYVVTVPSTTLSFFFSILFGKLRRQLKTLPQADFLIAVGRRTHLPMLLAHLWFGGKRILLMRSIWPLSWFDFAIIPQHDNPNAHSHTLITKGVINAVKPNNAKRESQGLILIGGPSKHFNWNSEHILSQLEFILAHNQDLHWLIANSRRTPDDFPDKLSQLSSNYSFIDHTDTTENWLTDTLALAQQVWVSPDSVSMLYEAITSGAEVGSLELEKSSLTRVVKGIQDLVKSKHITPFTQWQSSLVFNHPDTTLNEAQRAANWILNHE
jgi:mitochondrial fission protein ELM1